MSSGFGHSDKFMVRPFVPIEFRPIPVKKKLDHVILLWYYC